MASDYVKSSVSRWLRWFALAVVFAVACAFLANWQLNRREQVVKIIERIDRNYSHQRVRLEVMVPKLDQFKLSRQYRKVWVHGHYLIKQQELVRNRPQNGAQGFTQIVPFELDNGKVIVIDRGWLPAGQSPERPDRVSQVPSGNLYIDGRLQPGEGATATNTPPHQVTNIDLPYLAKTAGIPEAAFYTAAYLQLSGESPAPKGFTPQKEVRPDITEGNHLSYAFQWVIFAVMAFIALGWAIRQERLHLRAKNDPTFVIKKRRRVGDEDNAAEDALLAERD
jgi:cytochrome oxidase assembly protein ShyY1